MSWFQCTLHAHTSCFSKNFTLIFVLVEVLYFCLRRYVDVILRGTAYIALYLSLSLTFCLGRSRAAKNNSRAASHRQVPVSLNAVGAMWGRRALAG